jgi:hypothetical protein
VLGSGARARTGAPAQNRRTHCHRRRRSGPAAARRGVRRLSPEPQLDRGAESPDRLSLGRTRSRAHPRLYGRAGRLEAGRDSGEHRADVAALQQATGTIPIVFTGLYDPVGAGRAATSPDLRWGSSRSGRRCCSCSRTSCPGSAARPSCSIPINLHKSSCGARSRGSPRPWAFA